jgi:hypothetical protein
MADPKDNYSGVSNTLEQQSKLPLYGATTEQMQELQDAQKEALTALEQRYAQPNWYKVAAGFAKPQLGGFMASLGSASEAMGENVEQQRAQQLPIAQMRAQLAQTNLLLNKNKIVTEKIEKWKKEHPNQVPSASELMEWQAEAPNSPTVQAIANQQKTSIEQQGQNLQLLRDLYSTGQISKSEYGNRLAQLQNYTSVPSQSTGASGVAPSVTPSTETSSVTTTPQKITFKTPEKLLDNLRVVESSKDEFALHPDSKAMGPYQFLPETAQMLNKQGIKFNPFDENEARSAADQYIQKLVKENGGDYKKALAAYGGFKTKDPSGYVNKVLKGVDLSKRETSPTPLSLEETGLPGEKASEQSATTIKGLEDSNTNYINYINNNKRNVTDERRNYLERGLSIVDDPKIQQAMGQLYKNEGFVSGLQTALQEGINFALNHTGGALTAQVAFPVDKVITATNTDPPTKQKLRELMRIVMSDSLEDIKAGTSALGGGHMNAVEFQNVMGMFPTTSEPYKLMRQYLATRAARNELVSDLHKNWKKYSSTPNYAQKPLQNFFNLDENETAYDTYKTRHRNALKLAD